MTMERILLQTIKFDLQVEHPYYYLLKFAKVLKGGDDNNSTSLYQTSNRKWNGPNNPANFLTLLTPPLIWIE